MGVLSPEEFEALEQGGGGQVISPEQFTKLEMSQAPPEEKDPGLLGRITGRLLGTDVDDPLELERMGAILGGGLGGSMLGSRIPPAPGVAGLVVNPVTGALAGGLAGVIGGAVAPEATLETMEALGLADEGTREMEGLSNEELARVVQGEALLELVTAGAATGIRAAGRLIGKSATGLTKADMAMAREADAMGIQLAPFQLGERGLGRGIINVMGRFPFIGSKAKTVGEAAEDAIKLKVAGAPSRIAPILAGSDVGLKMWDDASSLFKSVGKKFDERYSELALQANRAGVFYKMSNTTSAAQGTLEALSNLRSPRTGEVPAEAGEAVEGVIRLLEGQGLAKLKSHTLGQADELLNKMDDYIASVEPGQRKRVLKFLSPIKGAIKQDIAQNGIGPEAATIGRAQAELDAEFSSTMANLFETSAAKRMETVTPGGLKGVNLPSKAATRTPIDKLMRTVVDLDSPQIMTELSRIVTKDTYKTMAATQLQGLLDSSVLVTKKGNTLINPEALKTQFGLKGPTARAAAIDTMLKKADHPMELKDLQKVSQIADKIAGSPIPNWSTFIARRASLGGAQSLLRGAFPLAALTGGAAAGAAAGSGLVGGLAFFFGTKGLIGAVSNPLNARLFKEVLAPEGKAIAKRAAYVRLVEQVAEGMVQGGIEATDQIDQKVLEYFRSPEFKEHVDETANMIFGEQNG